MISKGTGRTIGWAGAAMVGLAVLALLAGNAAAQGNATGGGTDNSRGMIAIGAALAIGLAGVGTGIAQSHIGAAAVGATAENPKNFSKGIIFVALPETIVLFGFVAFFLLSGQM